MISPDDFTPDENNLIARLQNAPQPRLSPRAFGSIEQRMLENMALPSAPAARPRLQLSRTVFVAPLAAALVLVVFVASALLTDQNTRPADIPTVETNEVSPTSEATRLPVIVTAQSVTTQPTDEPATATSGTSTSTTVPSPQASSTLTPTAEAQGAEVVVEGPIQRIEGNLIFVYNLPVRLNDQQQPRIAALRPGDMIRVEGTFEGEGSTLVLVAASLVDLRPPTSVPVVSTPSGDNPGTTTTEGVTTNPVTGETWTDPGDCSNPPPDWAPANGWRARCQSAAPPGNSGNAGQNNPGQGGNNNNNGLGGGNGGGNGNGNGNGNGRGGG